MERPHAAVILALALLVNAAAGMRMERDLDMSFKERPVMKAVRMLQDMKDQLQADLADDKEVHEMLSCWCETNEKEKTASLEMGEARESNLESEIGEAAAKMEELKTKRATAQEEVDKDWQALNEAKALRLKEAKESHEEQKSLIEAITASGNAIIVLSKHHPELLEVRKVAKHLSSARVVSLAKFWSPDKFSDEKAGQLKAFLSEASGAVSFLAVPGFQSYAPQSGQVFGILKQMKEDFSRDLKETQGQETAAKAEFNELKSAKDDEISAGKELVVQLDQQFADFGEKHAAALKDLENTKLQIESDSTFLKNLKKKCSESEGEFDARIASRLEELKAVDETIEILNDDEAFANFDTTVNTAFLQVSASAAQKEKMQRQRAAAVLVDAANSAGMPALSLLALKVKLDNFVKVKEDIENMIGALNKQQSDEVAKRDWCKKEMSANNQSTAAAYDKKANLESKIAELTKTIETISDDMKSTKATMKDMQAQMKKASEIREADSASNRQTINDQRMTQIVLTKALSRMKEVYAFLLQQPGAAHTQTSGTDTDPGNGPAKFKKYEKNAGGARILKMLKEIIADSKKTEDETIRTEQDDQVGYETFMKDSNNAISTYSTKLTDMTKTKAKSKEELSMKESDFKSTMGELEDLSTTLGDLAKTCNYLLSNFDKRQEARSSEIGALKEATAILDGMK